MIDSEHVLENILNLWCNFNVLMFEVTSSKNFKAEIISFKETCLCVVDCCKQFNKK